MRSFILASLLGLSSAAPAADKVTTLPGWGAPLTDTYSGYLNIPGGKSLHYLFYASQTGKATDPVVLWFNGGPGCSSLEGAFQESGPLWTAPGGNGLQVNEYSWNKFSHNLFLEAPACVGFSYADKASGCNHNDTGTAADNLQALRAWFGLFPEYAANDFFITGESYAGIYIPSLAYDIYNYNTAGGTPHIPLKGILVGNGCIGNDAGVCGQDGYGDYLSLAQFHGHAFLSDKSFDAVVKACPDWNNPSSACQDAVNAASNEVGSNFDVYDLYAGAWGICSYAKFARNPRRPVRAGSVMGKLMERARALLDAAGPNATNACTSDDDLTTYLNRADVQAALHVKAPAGGWQECGGINYNSDIADERTTIYPTLINKAGIQIVIYNGQSDACVPVTDNQWWTSSMGLKEKVSWTAWTADDGTMGGYVTEYATGAKSNFTFVTVRGAGHMVPQTQPVYAYKLAKTFIEYGTLV